MLALAIVLSVLILIALLRFGVIVEYSEVGLKLWAKIAFLKFRLLDEDKYRKPKKKKKKKDKEKKINIAELKPGSLNEFMEILRTVGNVFNRFRRRLLIKQLILYYTSASENAANTAMQFGAASAVFETIVPAIKRNFRVRRLDLRAAADFTSTTQKIYAKINVSLAVWEVFYIAFALMPLIISIFRKKPDRNKDKAKSKNNCEDVSNKSNDRKNGDKKDG